MTSATAPTTEQCKVRRLLRGQHYPMPTLLLCLSVHLACSRPDASRAAEAMSLGNELRISSPCCLAAWEIAREILLHPLETQHAAPSQLLNILDSSWDAGQTTSETSVVVLEPLEVCSICLLRTWNQLSKSDDGVGQLNDLQVFTDCLLYACSLKSAIAILDGLPVSDGIVSRWCGDENNQGLMYWKLCREAMAWSQSRKLSEEQRRQLFLGIGQGLGHCFEEASAVANSGAHSVFLSFLAEFRSDLLMLQRLQQQAQRPDPISSVY